MSTVTRIVPLANPIPKKETVGPSLHADILPVSPAGTRLGARLQILALEFFSNMASGGWRRYGDVPSGVPNTTTHDGYRASSDAVVFWLIYFPTNAQP